MATTTIEKGQPGSKALFRDSYFLHKLHSLTGILPIGLFMIFHLTVNAYSLRGANEFNTAARAIGYAPFVALLEIGVIFVPLLFHAIYGTMIAMEMPGPGGNVAHYGYGRNWLYVLQRWSGVIAFAYLIFHTVDTTLFKRWWEMTTQNHEIGFQSISYASLAYRFAQPWYLAVQIIGVTASAFHLGNGIFNFAIRWGIAIGKEAQRIAGALGWLVGLGLTLLGCWIAVNFAMQGKVYQDQYPSMRALVEGEARKVMDARAGGRTPYTPPVAPGAPGTSGPAGTPVLPGAAPTNAVPVNPEVNNGSPN
jgi:succinate dehydrogenase / fumarate reductase, cytochrome b subunit